MRFSRLVVSRVLRRSLCSDAPVRYTKSKAASYKARDTFRPPPSDAPEAQRYAVLLSVAAVLVYFCVLREENDLDAILRRPLSSTVPGIVEPDEK